MHMSIAVLNEEKAEGLIQDDRYMASRVSARKGI